jgi:DNA-binding IclR family transcriptional regulator
MASDDGRSRTIGAVGRTVSILEEIRARNGAGVTELARALDLSKSTVHHYLASLRRQNLLRQEDGEYRIGLQFLAYAGHARENEPLFRSSKDDVDELARRTGETVRLVVESSGYGLTLYQSTGENVDAPRTRVGGMEHLHATAGGKALLALLPEADVETIISEYGLPEVTANTISEEDSLRTELERIRSKGMAFDDCERFEGTRCVASTLSTDSPDLLGAISVSAPVERMPKSTFRAEIPRALQDATERADPVDDYQFRHEVPCIARTL